MESRADSRIWALGPSGGYSVKSLAKLLAASEAIEKEFFEGLSKTNSPKRINILVWAMIFGSLNCSSILSMEVISHYLSSSICPLCQAPSEYLRHLFFYCCFSMACWRKLFSTFHIQWVFEGPWIFSGIWRIFQGKCYTNLGGGGGGAVIKPQTTLLWFNEVKALLAEI